MNKTVRAVMAVLLVAGWGAPAARANGFVDPLDIAAVPDVHAAHEILVAVTRAGDRLVAAGLRGLVIYSDDRGGTWKQAAVPVQVDLTALFFLTPTVGWATGHSGVVLHTTDGGATWSKQFDGNGNLAFLDDYKQRVAHGDATAAPFVQTMTLNTRGGPLLPYLDVLFENPNDGWAVGPYGMLMGTHDGGAHWNAMLDRIDNPDALNLNALAEIDGNLYIAGEKGRVYRLDRAQNRFVAFDTGYAGSLFGIVGDKTGLLTFGLLGHALHSTDGGAHWQPVTTNVAASISGGAIAANGRAVLATQAGVLLAGDPTAGVLQPVATPGGYPLSAVAAAGGNSLALVGLGGISIMQQP